MDRNMLISAIEYSSEGILIADIEGNVIYVNSAYESTTGLKKKEMLNKNLKDLLKQNIINKAASLSVLKDEKPAYVMHQYVTGKSALTTANPIYDENNVLIGVISNTRNITELIKLRNELNESKMLTQRYSDEIRALRKQATHNEDFIYASQVIDEVLKLASKAAEFDSTILIHGESGTGKEVLAKFVHNESPRKKEPFIKVNCAAIPNELFESELFGYMEGSFTGAIKGGKPGMFELANNGTILLDEIGELPMEVQSKLLRVLQEREVMRIGGEVSIPIDVRVLAATNKDLKKEVKDGNFREDLYFRLNVIPITIPPLRKRREDIPELIIYFLEKLNRRYRKTVTISNKSIEALTSHSWPGNVRELENLIEYLFIMTNKEEIEIEDLPTRIISQQLIQSSDIDNELNESKLTYLLELYEKYIIKDALSKFPSVRQTAQALGIHASTLSRKMKKYELDIDETK